MLHLIRSKLGGYRRRLQTRRRAKRLAHWLLTQWKGATSARYRQAIQRLRQQRKRYGLAQPLRGGERVLLICEASIPQCFKYRVQQRQESLALLGVRSSWLPWQNQKGCLDALQSHSAVIFYRTPLLPGVEKLVQEARRLKLPISWEVDDLIFDAAVLQAAPTLRELDHHTFRGLLKGARLYRRALESADRGIASTPALAEAMAAVGEFPVDVIHNGLDAETLKIVGELSLNRQSCDPEADPQAALCRVVYGSGTNTHNLDVLEATEALLGLLSDRPQLRLRIIGDLQLPPSFEAFSSQIERFRARDYASYLALLAECQINLAPLEPSLFNDCKSNIKWLEAAALGIPSVCSPRAEFQDAVVDGVNGLLCNTPQQWRTALERLVDQPQLRQRMGAAARQTAHTRYGPEALAHRELDAWWTQTLPNGPISSPGSRPTRVLSLNVYYAPQSFGGATLVAEQMNSWLAEQGKAEVGVFCLIPPAMAGGKALHRFTIGKLQVFGVPTHLAPPETDTAPDASSKQVLEQFASVLDGFQPDLIHVHCIQGIGLGVLELALEHNIPYVITLHDAWWLCALQFMLTPKGEYCDQKEISLGVCAACTGRPELVEARSNRIRTCLNRAEALLAPSQFFVDLFAANGFPQVRLHRNGIVPPQPADVKDPAAEHGGGTINSLGDHTIRFGYLGGNVDIKGFHEIQQVFRQLATRPDLQLVLVDNTLNLGHASYFAPDLQGLQNVKVIPAFEQGDADSFYSQIDVLLFPTRWKESFGLAIREALARGLWVISTDAGGAVEDLQDGQNGRIIAFGDRGEALSKAVLEACTRVRQWRQNPGLRPTTAIRSCSEQAEELLAIIQDLLEKH
uniref:glycosyltransferase n=1 Tax=Cyanobium sp. TaxID=2164130 RepID=UPI00404772FA